MRWTSGRRSVNIEDRRGFSVSRRAAGGGIGTIVLVLLALYFGVDPSVILNQTQMTVPGTHSFTHGSSAQRMHWFKLGLQTGSIGQCNTFQTTDRRH